MKTQVLRRGLSLGLCCLFASRIFAQAPANDNCASAITATTTAVNNTLSAATSSTPAAAGFGTIYDVWYSFTVPANRNFVNITVSPTGSTTDFTRHNGYIELFKATNCAQVIPVNSLGIVSIQTDMTGMNLSANTTYFFRVFTNRNPNTGTTRWSFDVSVAFGTVPTNNECNTATPLTVGAAGFDGNLANATASASIPIGDATGNPDDDVWFSFMAARTYATVTVQNASTLNTSGTMLQGFSGSCSGLTPLASGQDAVNLTGLLVGSTYYVRVYSRGSTGADQVTGPATGTAFKIAVTPAATSRVSSGKANEMYDQTNLSAPDMVWDPWEVTYGPDNHLWITEAKGYKVYRMNPTTGARTTVLDLSRGSRFLATADTSFNMDYEIGNFSPQGGLAGLALHPDWATKKFVYISYVHSYEGTLGTSGTFYTNRIVRFTYNTSTGKLESPVPIITNLPGSNDHNSQRMVIAPVGGTNFLFYAAGDLGAGQFSNRDRPMHAQTTGVYEGKILRFNLEPQTAQTGLDQWIPDDNPYGSSDATWCIGIRNNQGFVYDPVTGKLFGSSHGPYSDDEINIIEGNRNYGHPHVIGYAADDNYNGVTAGAAKTDNNGVSSCPVIVDESNNAAGLANYKDPLFSAYAAPAATITNIWTNNPGNGGWPSEGWTGMDKYNSKLIPGWKNSIIIASLKWGRLLRFKLHASGNFVLDENGGNVDSTNIQSKDTISYFGGRNRFRDMALDANGRDMYVVMDRSTTSSGPSNANPIVPACPGCIQQYNFLGYPSDAVTTRSLVATTIPAANGTANNCQTGTTITIDDRNNNLWVPITGEDGNLVAEINAMGQAPGEIQSSFFTFGNVRNTGGVRFLGRNIYINPTNNVSGIRLRLYLTEAEFLTWKGGGSSTIADLRLYQNTDVCRSFPSSTMTVTAATPDHAYKHGAVSYVVQVNNISITGAASFYFGNGGSFTLPVTDLTFTGSLQQDKGTVLNWKTESEEGVRNYVVERSTDGNSFTAIGQVAASGIARQASRQLVDAGVFNLNATTIFYRLRIVGSNNEIRYSNTVAVSLNSNLLVSVTPNPVSGVAQLRVEPNITGLIEWQLFDGAGRIVNNGAIKATAGVPTVNSVNMTGLAQGTYYFSVKGAGVDQRIKVQKM